jgi:hypothetical protein
MSKGKETGAAAAAPSLEEVNIALTAELGGANEAIAKLQSEIETLKSELKDAAEVIADLKDQLKEGGKAKGPVGKVGKDKFRIVGSFKKAGKTFTPADIAADENILKALVAGNSTLIEKITD